MDSPCRTYGDLEHEHMKIPSTLRASRSRSCDRTSVCRSRSTPVNPVRVSTNLRFTTSSRYPAFECHVVPNQIYQVHQTTAKRHQTLIGRTSFMHAITLGRRHTILIPVVIRDVSDTFTPCLLQVNTILSLTAWNCAILLPTLHILAVNALRWC